MEAIAIALPERDSGRRRRLPRRNWGRLPPLRDLLVTSSLRSGIGTDDQWLAARLYGTGTFRGIGPGGGNGGPVGWPQLNCSRPKGHWRGGVSR
jgi:hypothetical protein